MRCRTVIVTGGAQGIGLAITKAFVQNGDFVAIFDINADKKVIENVNNSKIFRVNVTKEGEIISAVEKVIEERGTIDILVNNAGIQYISPVEDFPEEKWDSVIDVILKGTFLMTKHVVPIMKQQKKGRIINISSAHGRVPDAYKSAYIAAKFGQVGFTKAIALETAQYGITVNTIMPGPVRTQLIKKQLPKLAEQDGTTIEEALHHHILGKQWIKRLLEPSEIASAVLFLASDAAGAITGEEIGVTGGI